MFVRTAANCCTLFGTFSLNASTGVGRTAQLAPSKTHSLACGTKEWSYGSWRREGCVGRQQLIAVVASIGVIILVSVLQQRSRFFAAVLASMPLMAPLALWVVFAGSNGDHQKSAEFVSAMVPGVIATLGFVVGTYVALRYQLSFPWVLALGAASWLVVLGAGRLTQSL